MPSKLQDKTIDAFFPRSANVLKSKVQLDLFLPQVSILKQIFFFQILPGVNLTVVRTYYIYISSA